MMPTSAQIDEQVELERKAISCGIEALHRNTRNLEEKAYASASVYGVSSIQALIPILCDDIDNFVKHIADGRAHGTYSVIKQQLGGLETLAIAGITCKVIFDKVFSRDEDDHIQSSVGSAIGRAIETELQMRAYEAHAGGLVKAIKDRYWHRSCGSDQRRRVMQLMMRRSDNDVWEPWSRRQRGQVGLWLLARVINCSGWFQSVLEGSGRQQRYVIKPSETLTAMKAELIARSELFAPMAWPMLIEPNPWTPETSGGYLLNEVMHGHKMIRREFECTIVQGGQTYSFLNQVQKTAWKVNPFIFSVATQLSELGVSVGKFIPSWSEPAPTKPVDIETNGESRHRYNRDTAEWNNRRQNHVRRCIRTIKTMECAEMFVDRDRFYLPWSFDYRGRAYPIPAYLTPHDTDFGKSLLYFADTAFVTPEAEEWLAFQVATTYGLDKSTMEERVKWTKDNVRLIEDVVADPVGRLPDWESADEPWQFLAACEEYVACVVECSRQATGLPVATDATCSGLQILAGLAQDADTARMVNVLPTPKPQDAYKAVAEKARPNCPERLQEYMDRKITKRVVMTIPYNAKEYSNRDYILEAFEEKGVELSKEELTQVTKAIRGAMKSIFPGPMEVMDWINKQVSLALKAGRSELRWTSPSGFQIVQRLNKIETERTVLQIMGTVQRPRTGVAETDIVDKSRHKAATSPNLIHSLDASLLHLSVSKFYAPIGLIHDSVLCRATDMGVLSDVVRRVYRELFARESYLHTWAAQIGSHSQEPPVIGTLDAELVNESTYFFC